MFQIISLMVLLIFGSLQGQMADPYPQPTTWVHFLLKNYVVQKGNVFFVTDDGKAFKVSIEDLIKNGFIASENDLEAKLQESSHWIYHKSPDKHTFTLSFINLEGNQVSIKVIPILASPKNCLKLELAGDAEHFDGANTIEEISFELPRGIKLNTGVILLWKSDFDVSVRNPEKWNVSDPVMLYFNPCIQGAYQYILRNLSTGEQIYVWPANEEL